jgi:hypothetical protein
LAPYLAPESDKIQFDTVHDMLTGHKVSFVPNWPHDLKYKKSAVKVTRRWPRAGVLGGDVLAIPKKARYQEEAVKLIERLVSKKIQRTLAEYLYWVPVREDVYAELSAQEGGEKYFEVIREALRAVVRLTPFLGHKDSDEEKRKEREEHFQVIWDALKHVYERPTTLQWTLAEEVLSDALQAVLRQGAQGEPATATAIDVLLKPYVDRLKNIPREYMACAVIPAPEKTAGGGCQVVIQRGKYFKDLVEDLARDYNVEIEPAMLAKLNGRDELDDDVSLQDMRILLTPRPVPEY